MYYCIMKPAYVSRLMQPPDRSFFLLGPRGTGKSTWLRCQFPTSLYLDLLDGSLFLELSQAPNRLEAMAARLESEAWIVIDEIQKTPALLDEAHRLMESRGLRFALCGSSARKIRRGGVNLLAGRAITIHMEPFVSAELQEGFDLDTHLEWGSLPFVVLDPKNAAEILSAYVDTYLREEIREEGVVRKVPPFLRFLGIAGRLNGQAVNSRNISREAAVPRSSVDTYFSILTDTLVGYFLPAWQPRLKVREASHPKFYWFDTGAARAAAGLLGEPPDRLWKGAALETLIFHEMRVYNETSRKHRPIAFYRTASGAEIDFVIETQKARSDAPPAVVCVEVKLSERWDHRWERAMRDLAANPALHVDRMIGVYTGPRSYRFDNVDVLPATEFLKALHRGEVF